MSSSATRQRAYRERMKEQGFVQITIWVPAHVAADMVVIANQLSGNGSLELGPLRDTLTGKLVKRD